MPFYHQLGGFPAKRHMAFRKDDGGIYYEHLMGNLGFTGLQSLLYTLRRPTTVKAVEAAWVHAAGGGPGRRAAHAPPAHPPPGSGRRQRRAGPRLAAVQRRHRPVPGPAHRAPTTSSTATPGPTRSST